MYIYIYIYVVIQRWIVYRFCLGRKRVCVYISFDLAMVARTQWFLSRNFLQSFAEHQEGERKGRGRKSNVRQGINIGKICCYCGTRTNAGKGRRKRLARKWWRGEGFLRVESKPITYYNCRRRGRGLTVVGVAVRHPSSRLMAPLSCQ